MFSKCLGEVYNLQKNLFNYGYVREKFETNYYFKTIFD